MEIIDGVLRKSVSEETGFISFSFLWAQSYLNKAPHNNLQYQVSPYIIKISKRKSKGHIY